MPQQSIVEAGGGGFIGGLLVADLRRQGHKVRSVDLKLFPCCSTSGLTKTNRS